MSYDLQLDTKTHDLVIDPATGDLQLLSAARRIAQQIKVTLLVFLGEWFLDTSFGMPYLESILVKNPRLGTINAVFRARIIDVPGVIRVRRLEFDIDRVQRALTVTFEAETTEGLTGPQNLTISILRRGA